MTRTIAVGLLLAVSVALVAAQETKPVPKDSLRISIPGCAKNAVFTTARRTVDEPGTIDVAEGVHMHMNGPKKVMSEIKAHQASMIEITGIVRRNDLDPGGVSLGKGIRIQPGPTPSGGGSVGGLPLIDQVQIDVESWRQIPGECRSR
jgi:hypothetical protein